MYIPLLPPSCPRSNSSLFKSGFNFQSLGVGGLDKEFGDIFRRVFASRICPPQLVEELGIQHVRGMLLYGPPGCGKTLIARQLGKALNAKEPKIVKGPDVLSKFVGESEANIRKLFEDADAEQAARGDDSDLHIIIMDEMDAICKRRGSTRDGTGVHDSIVNQLLSKIDGVDVLNNILLIGMTNRLDMIDDALTRPGRLEVKVEIGLPDVAGRAQILQIHTTELQKFKRMSDDVRLDELAELTKNFTGAEIAGAVRSAKAFALARETDIQDLGKSIDPRKVIVTMDDFERAVSETTPAFGVQDDELKVYYRNGMFHYGEDFEAVYNTVQRLINQVRNSEKTPLMSCLVSGAAGSGKSAFIAKLAADSQFPLVKRIGADTLVGYGEQAKAGRIVDIFEDAYKSPLSIILLDDLERLLEYVPIGHRFSNIVLQTLLVLINRPPPKTTRRLMILATTSAGGVLGEMGLHDVFNVHLKLPFVMPGAQMRMVLDASDQVMDQHLDAVTELLTDPVGIKRLLMLVEMARTEDGEITPDNFAVCLSELGM